MKMYFTLMITLFSTVTVARSMPPTPWLIQVSSEHASVADLDTCRHLTKAQTQELSQLLPIHIRDWACRPSHKDRINIDAESTLGPNCYAATMFWHNQHQTLEFVKDDQFKQFFKLFPDKVDMNKMRPGDLVVFIRPDLSTPEDPWITHAAIFLNSNNGDPLIWNKLGPTKISDRGDGTETYDPSWTISKVSEILEEFDSAEPEYYRKK